MSFFSKIGTQFTTTLRAPVTTHPLAFPVPASIHPPLPNVKPQPRGPMPPVVAPPGFVMINGQWRHPNPPQTGGTFNATTRTLTAPTAGRAQPIPPSAPSVGPASFATAPSALASQPYEPAPSFAASQPPPPVTTPPAPHQDTPPYTGPGVPWGVLALAAGGLWMLFGRR